MTGARDDAIVFGLNYRNGAVAVTELRKAYLKRFGEGESRA